LEVNAVNDVELEVSRRFTENNKDHTLTIPSHDTSLQLHIKLETQKEIKASNNSDYCGGGGGVQ